ncbi:MAG TPA: hypothetical protein VNC50_04210 [Planctomycetia bacterium]|jgi:hypothetical protein|nr:hypothetical protein [Planctomycetia bacterium]
MRRFFEFDFQELQTMAKKAAGKPNMSEFIRLALKANPKASAKEVIQGWKDAGNSGELKNSLFYLVKNKAGYSKPRGGKKRRGRPVGSKNVVAAAPKAAGPRKASSVYLAMEQTLDGLVQQADGLGETELASAFRSARRTVSAKLV